MDIFVWSPGVLTWNGKSAHCAIGRNGIIANKREGDGATPEGTHPLRQVLYRPDRVERPVTGLPVSEIRVSDAWCDDPVDSSYNRMVQLPFKARHEALWREENVYDIIVVLGYNDDPVKAGLGSAIFMHITKPGYEPTDGCIALALADLTPLLSDCDRNSLIHIHGEPARSIA